MSVISRCTSIFIALSVETWMKVNRVASSGDWRAARGSGSHGKNQGFLITAAPLAPAVALATPLLARRLA